MNTAVDANADLTWKRLLVVLQSDHRKIIEKRAAEAHAELRDMVQSARLACGLPPLIHLRSSRWIDLPPAYRCPECGGRLGAEITEYSVPLGVATREGVDVYCIAEAEAALADVQDDVHRSWHPNWPMVQRRAGAWVRTRVRITTHDA